MHKCQFCRALLNKPYEMKPSSAVNDYIRNRNPRQLRQRVDQQRVHTLRFCETRGFTVCVDVHPNCIQRKQFTTVPCLRSFELCLCQVVVSISRDMHLRQPFSHLLCGYTCHSLHCRCSLGASHNCHQSLVFGMVRCENKVSESFHISLGRIVLCLLNGIFCRVLGAKGFFFCL